MVKGLGYAIETVVALIILVIFSLGALQITGFDQDWNEFQKEVAAQDITYSLEKTGHTENFLKRGETGTLQTVVNTVSDRDMEISGLVSELPVTEISLGFYTVDDDREIVDLTELESCSEDDISEIQDFSSDPILETDGYLENPSEHDTTLFFGNTNATESGLRAGYDSLWVDNGTECQFAEEDGPFYLEDIFYWGDDTDSAQSDYYDFKSIEWDDDSNSGEAEFYRATQPVRITNLMEPGPNEIRTDITLDMVDQAQLESEDFEIAVFREEESLDFMDEEFEVMVDILRESSVMVMANPDAEEEVIENEFLSSTGVSWIDLDYQDGYDGGQAEGAFSDEDDSVRINTFYNGINGIQDFQLIPPGKTTSNETSDLRPSRTIFSDEERFDVSSLETSSEDLVEGEDMGIEDPDEYCADYDYDDSDPEQVDLAGGTVNFENEGNIDIISVKLGQSDEVCDEFVERGIIFEFDQNNLYLDGETVSIGGIEYYIEANIMENNNDCDFYGECVEFIPTIKDDNDNVELMVTRESFDNLEGRKFAMTGYLEEFEEDQRAVIASTFFWMVGDEVGFESGESQGVITTESRGSIEGEVYLPYTLHLRWSE